MKRGGFLASIAAFAALPLASVRRVYAESSGRCEVRHFAIREGVLYDFVAGYKGVDEVRFMFLNSEGHYIKVSRVRQYLWNHTLRGSRLGWAVMATVRPPKAAVRVQMMRYGARKQRVESEYFAPMPQRKTSSLT